MDNDDIRELFKQKNLSHLIQDIGDHVMKYLLHVCCDGNNLELVEAIVID